MKRYNHVIRIHVDQMKSAMFMEMVLPSVIHVQMKMVIIILAADPSVCRMLIANSAELVWINVVQIHVWAFVVKMQSVQFIITDLYVRVHIAYKEIHMNIAPRHCIR